MEADRGAIPPPERDSGSKNGRKSRIWFWLSPPAAHAERWVVQLMCETPLREDTSHRALLCSNRTPLLVSPWLYYQQ
jgi:hypothetical protein